MNSSDTAPLYDKPHAVDLAQVLMVFQYFMVVSTSIGLGPRLLKWGEAQTSDVPFMADLADAVRIGGGFPIFVVIPSVVILTIPYVATVLALGSGRPWARPTAVVFVLVNTVIGIAGLDQTYGTVPTYVLSPIWIALAAGVVGGLATRKARQWSRQGGWAPWYERYAQDQARGRPRPRR
ncbi:hypothetical protein AB0B28_08675 [Glycomyces sp. NPDC046736]|uniref:hypothetical protein n=1 Tax=Glycomyces sp. NPDC046736 TaxID=3155615 RepID=UPI0033C1A812